MSVCTESLTRGIASVLVATLTAGAPLPAQAQTCPPGYYYASDGNCYPGPPPSYPPPPYDTAPPVEPPPPVLDGLLIGLGLLVVGAIIASDHDDHRGRPVPHRPPQRHGPRR